MSNKRDMERLSVDVAAAADEYTQVIEGLKKLYKLVDVFESDICRTELHLSDPLTFILCRNKIKPLETTYDFEGFHSAPLTDADVEAKPLCLLIGQYSVGKTTFIKQVSFGSTDSFNE